MLAKSAQYILCKDCGNEINVKNLPRHKKKCVAVAKAATKKKKPTPKTNHGELDTAYNPLKERKSERALDGSKDYPQFREHGRFGSHSLYDDMNDEASA